MKMYASMIFIIALSLFAEAHHANAEPKSQKSETAKPFKFTITTDDPSYDETGFLVAVHPVNTYPVHYDLDCNGDGQYEYAGLTESHKCRYSCT